MEPGREAPEPPAGPGRAAAHGGARVQQGWLHKQGGAKSGVAAHGWRRRHFVLQPTRGELAYYDSRDALRPLGEISLATFSRLLLCSPALQHLMTTSSLIYFV